MCVGGVLMGRDETRGLALSSGSIFGPREFRDFAGTVVRNKSTEVGCVCWIASAM